MKQKLFTYFAYALSFLSPLFLSGCLITEVNQSTEVKEGDTFTTTIVVTDVNADANPNVGAVAVLVPNDWEFTSGTYNSDVGTGNLILDPNDPPIYGNLDSTIVPPADMKWVRLLSDNGFAHDANVTHEATVNFKVGALSGDFPIGYMVTKNSPDLLPAINLTEQDSDAAWADSSMGHMVAVNKTTSVNDINATPNEYALEQNYPNPFNPSTNIAFTLKESGKVKLTIYNALGNEVTTLVNNVMPAGRNTVQFDAINLSSGVYIYKIQTSSFVESRKMILMK